ncbi:MAG: hypothetical protein Q4A90_04265 [Streptococcus sp.]|nr:hypothetical protein [Streptococcus sp.]
MMFKNLKDIEFEKTNENGETVYFVKPDGRQANLFERICLIGISLIVGLLYVAFRMLIGVLFLAITCAVFLNHFLKGDSAFLSYFLLALTDIRILIFGCMIGLGFWFLDM